jgi:hypothetical protein
MESTIFSPNLELLMKQDVREATATFGRLLWCEAARLGLTNIVVSGDVNSADGGIDAKAERIEGSGLHAFYFQIKAGTSFKPWQTRAIAKELFGEAKAAASKSRLGRAVRRCLDTGGTYILVVPGHDLLAENHSNAVSLLRSAFAVCGYPKAHVEVWGVRQLANMMERYPSLCLDLGGLGDARFQSVQSWAANGDMTPHLEAGSPQNNFIARVRTALHGFDVQHIRIIGEPGIGKTRLVLEALRGDRKLADRAIYVPDAEFFQKSRLFFELLKHDREYAAVLVVDECDDAERASIYRALKGRNRLKLVTIDHGPETSSDPGMEVIQFPPLEDAQIEAILRSYIGKSAHAYNWVAWCEGSARVAHAVGDNLKRNPQDILKAPALIPIWDRFVLGYQKRTGAAADTLMTIVRHIALFRKFGAARPLQSESHFIASLAQRVDPSITVGRFEVELAKLKDRRILQGSHTLRLVPKALHIHLWKQWWELHGASASLGTLMDEMPATLRRWFLDMLVYSNGVRSAQDAIKEVLSAEDGPFTKLSFVISKSGAQFLNVMAEAHPAATLAVLDRTVGSLAIEEVAGLAEANQTLVRALEKIAVWRDHFGTAARLLAHLTNGDRSTYSNNARGTLVGMFMLRFGPTQATATERLAFANKLLVAKNASDRLLALDLIKSFMSDRQNSRIVGVEYQGLAPEIEFWLPKIWNDLYVPRRDAFEMLRRASNPDDQEWQVALSNAILEAADEMLGHRALADLALEALQEQLHFPSADGQALVNLLINRTKHPFPGTPKGVVRKLSKLLEATSTGSFGKRFARFVTFNTYQENYSIDAAGKYAEETSPLERVVELARELVHSDELREENLDQILRSAGDRTGEFGKQVARLSLPQGNLDNQILKHAAKVGDDGSRLFLMGYLEEIKTLDLRRWEDLALGLLKAQPVARWQIDTVAFSGFSEAVLNRLLVLYDEGAVDPSRFANIGYARFGDDLPLEKIESVCMHLEASTDAAATRVAIAIASHRFVRRNEPCSRRLLWTLLVSPSGLCRGGDSMASHYWVSLAKLFRARYAADDIRLLDALLDGHRKHHVIDPLSGAFETILEICKTHPTETWPYVAKALEESESRWSIAHWLGDSFRARAAGEQSERQPLPIDAFMPTQILEWLAADPSRGRLIVDALPKTVEQGPGGELTRRFIDLFGAGSAQAQTLMAHFDSGVRWGPSSLFYAQLRDRARNWILGASTEVSEWIRQWLGVLDRQIESAKIEEERGF